MSKAKSRMRVVLSQIEAEVLKHAGTQMELAAAPGLNVVQLNALKRALDKLSLGLADARGRDAERGVQ